MQIEELELPPTTAIQLNTAPAGKPPSWQARIAPEYIGSIDTPSVRKLVEEILEGGAAAFKRRRLKYGF